MSRQRKGGKERERNLEGLDAHNVWDGLMPMMRSALQQLATETDIHIILHLQHVAHACISLTPPKSYD